MILRGLYFSVRMNFAIKRDDHVVYFKFCSLYLLKLNLSHKYSLINKMKLKNLDYTSFLFFDEFLQLSDLLQLEV
jgi:hypothetical protein